MNKLTRLLATAAMAFACQALSAAADGGIFPSVCNVVWTTPSKNSSGSMPLGNGDIGLNVWVEEGGDLLLYVGKTDSWDENSRLLKLGRLRLHFSHNPFAAGKPFRQVLRTEEGAIEIAAGQDGRELRARLWVDANRPAVRIETESEQAFELETRLEVWRTAERELNGNTPVIYLYNAAEKYRGYPNAWLSGAGKHVLRYALVAHAGDFTTARIPQMAWEFNNPPIVVDGCAPNHERKSTP